MAEAVRPLLRSFLLLKQMRQLLQNALPSSANAQAAHRVCEQVSRAGIGSGRYTLAVLALQGIGCEQSVSEAARLLRPLAYAGHPEAQTLLGGVLVTRAPPAAHEWHEGCALLCDASLRGNTQAQTTMASLEAQLRPRSADSAVVAARSARARLAFERLCAPELAAFFLGRAAAAGSPVARYNLGSRHMLAWMTAQRAGSLERALSLWAQCGTDFAPALHALGDVYRTGRGDAVHKDTARAVQYFGAAARLGFEPSGMNLAHMYINGDGVPQSRQLAVHWLRIIAPSSQEAVSMLASLGEPVSSAPAASSSPPQQQQDGGDAKASRGSTPQYGRTARPKLSPFD